MPEPCDLVKGFHPRSHRLQTPGHDPLIGLILGTIDILRGGLTAIGSNGQGIYLSNQATPVLNPVIALGLEIGHLLSDVATEMGLPSPGWSLTKVLQFGSFGSKDRMAAELARFMYLNGYDTRHFLTMSTSVAAAEIVLRSYFGLRRHLEPEYDVNVARLSDIAGTPRIGSNPRFLAMSLAAHRIACAANAGKIAVYDGNPLALNYAQWLTFLKSSFSWCSTQWQSPSEVLARYGQANERLLDERWPWVLASDPKFPIAQ